MSGRKGEDKFSDRGGTARNDGLYPINGARVGNGSSTEAQDSGDGTGGADRGDARDVTKTPWFNPVTTEEVSDCPGGVCPVPWAVATTPPVIQKDVVNHPSHYTDGGIECIEAIEAQLTLEEYRGYLKGNIAKYVWRERHKGGVESLKKAQWYMSRLIELDEVQNG